MRRIGIASVLVGLVLAGGFVFLNYHLVTTSRGTLFVKKTTPTFANTFVDTRSWGWLDLWRNQDVAVALVSAGHGEALPQVERFNRAIEAGVRTAEEFDARFGVSEKARATAERLRQLESEHKVLERTEEAVKRGADKAKELVDRLRDK